MTWRRFCVLLGGLSINSRIAGHIRAGQDEDNERIEDPKEAEKAVAQAWGLPL